MIIVVIINYTIWGWVICLLDLGDHRMAVLIHQLQPGLNQLVSFGIAFKDPLGLFTSDHTFRAHLLQFVKLYRWPI